MGIQYYLNINKILRTFYKNPKELQEKTNQKMTPYERKQLVEGAKRIKETKERWFKSKKQAERS